VGHQELEISGDGEVDPIWKLSNTSKIGGNSGMAENTKLTITRSFFELETPDFAWMFMWTVQTKYKHEKVLSTHDLVIFCGTDFRFCMEVHMDCLTKLQSTKVQEVQKVH